MIQSLTLKNGACRVIVEPNGSVAIASDTIALSLTESGLTHEHAASDCLIERSGEDIVTKVRRAGFRFERRVSLRSGDDTCVVHFSCSATAERSGSIAGLVDHWSTSVRAPFDYRWAPNLRPRSNLRIGSHCFRSPAVILSGSGTWVALIPDFQTESARADAHLCSLDLDTLSTGSSVLGYGIEPTRPIDHVYFEVDSSTRVRTGDTFRFEYYVLLGAAASRATVLRTVNDFLWRHFATSYLHSKLPQTVPFDGYADYAYPSLVSNPPFETFDINGIPAGGVAAEVAHAGYFQRPDPIVWNQAWFNGQRAAYGLGVHGKTRGRGAWLNAARRMTATTLAAPDWHGLWPAIYAYENREWWGSIPRLNGGRRRVHVADAAMTGEWLLNWERDVETTTHGMARLQGLCDRLCQLQEADGSIPPWFDWDESGLQPHPVLRQSAETGAATTFLSEVAAIPGFGDAKDAVLRGAEFLASKIMPGQDYQDFETFFSCSPKHLDMVDPYTGIRPQNSLAVYWTAKTMLGAHRLTGSREFLGLAQEATDVLSLYQQVWDPPYLNLYAFGGFGVMNTDAEWNDARQALFAPHYFAMYEVSGLEEYLERGRAALRASFVLASIPENALVSPMTYASYPPGLMPENFGHSGRDTPAGRSDACWGEAGALTSVTWLRRHYPTLVEDLHDPEQVI